MNQYTRRQVLRAGLATAALASMPRPLRYAMADGAKTRRPNLLLLVTDDQRADCLSCAGNPVLQTPNIDALAASGTRFRNSFSTTAICMSSRASILTGMYTRVHGVDNFTKPLPEELHRQTYSHLLHEAGYRTGFVGKWGVDAGKMLVEDYDYFAGYQGQGAYYAVGEKEHLTRVQGRQAIEFLQTCKADQPFCLAVSFKAPHVQDEGRFVPEIYPKYPYDPALGQQYLGQTVPAIATKDVAPLPAFFDQTLNRTRESSDFFPANYQETMKDLYRLITGVDQAVGHIMTELQKLGFDDNTVVIFTSDHGSFYGEHGFGGKWLMNEESIRTPMIVRDPRLAANRRGTTCDAMVLNVDVPSTLLDLAGIEIPPAMQGRTLMPLVRGENPSWRSEWFYENHFRNQKAGPIAASEGIRTADWKYIRYIDNDPMYEQLFDLKNDPREENNLATNLEHQDRLNAMRDRWKIWQASLDGFSIKQRWADPVV